MHCVHSASPVEQIQQQELTPLVTRTSSKGVSALHFDKVRVHRMAFPI